MLKTPLLVLFVVLGAFFWFTAAMFVRLAGDTVFADGSTALPLLYVAAFPVLYIAIVLSSVISRVPMRDMLIPVVLMTTTALLLDGFAIAFFPDLYGATDEHVRTGAAFIMWGGGMGMAVAWVIAARARVQNPQDADAKQPLQSARS
ncbi:MAG: hypothetical protein OHK0046_09760 [Anaerolineae bacterium]